MYFKRSLKLDETTPTMFASLLYHLFGNSLLELPKIGV